MSSPKQVAANRLNGKKTRGASTANGRQKSKMNARKHGLRSRRKAVLVDLGHAH